ncbi:hypothetical protein [Metallosphaera hakonensis]|uniref:HEAT repeat domain-containing protein n=2 Tax=Metallosphaera hakonensis TaxID=79601 RepID=A0A2U9IRJ8_9CREN|nr:hypothetical protein [Metallosphaera hakonensis]AWR98652.1 hypothetical protein DFR87_01865 [Metallosphaera hakonensis JCM 8857 = DSM 7519]
MSLNQKVQQCLLDYLKAVDLDLLRDELTLHATYAQNEGLYQVFLNSDDLRVRENAWWFFITSADNDQIKSRMDMLLETLDRGADLWPEVMNLVDKGVLNKRDILPFFKHQNHKVRIGPWRYVKSGRITQADLKPFLGYFIELLKSNDLEVRAKAWSQISRLDELRIMKKEESGKYKSYLEEVFKDDRFLNDLEGTYLDLLDGITRKDFLPFLWNGDPRVRIATWWIISDSPNLLELVERKVNVILDTISYPDPKFRVIAWNVIKDLGKVGLVDSKNLDLKPLLELLRDPDVNVRLSAWAVATALAETKDLKPYLDGLREVVSREDLKETLSFSLELKQILRSGKLPKEDVIQIIKLIPFQLVNGLSKLWVEDVEKLLVEGDENIWIQLEGIRKDRRQRSRIRSKLKGIREITRRFMTHEDLRLRALAWSYLHRFLSRKEVTSLLEHLISLLTAGDDKIEELAWSAIIKLNPFIDRSLWQGYSKRTLSKLESLWSIALTLLKLKVLSPSDFLEVKEKVIEVAKSKLVTSDDVEMLVKENIISMDDLWRIVMETQYHEVVIAVGMAYPSVFAGKVNESVDILLRHWDKENVDLMDITLFIMLRVMYGEPS